MSLFEFYPVKSFAALMLLYTFYLVFLKKETSYRWNRFFLLFAGIFSTVVPFLNFAAPTEKVGKMFTVVLAPVNISTADNKAFFYLNNSDILFLFYLAVVTLFMTRFVLRLYNIRTLIKSHESISLKGYRTVLLRKMHSPFSFFSTIFLPEEKLKDSELDKILEHEAVHINENHSMDIIIYELIASLQWFNPFVWLCRKELIAQHEFSADSKLVKGGIEKNGYKQLLFSYSMQLGGTSVTNNFNSLLKRRFEMLSKTTSEKKGKVKVLFSIPVILFLAFLFGCKSEGVNNTAGPSILNPNNSVSKDSQEQAYTYVDEMPSYPAGVNTLLNFIGKNVTYPEIAKKAGVQGKVMVAFVVEKDGSLSNVEVIKGIGSGCDEEAVRVCKLMDKWNPGKQAGKPVRVRMVIPFQFKLQ